MSFLTAASIILYEKILFEKAVTVYPDFNILSVEEKNDIFIFQRSNDSSLCQSLLSNFTKPFNVIV